MNSVKPDRPEIFEHNDSAHKIVRDHEGFTLAHLSDPHLSLLQDIKFKEILNKRAYGYFSWYMRRNVKDHGESLAALFNDLRHIEPDHIAVTGDLTHLGLPSEFQVAREMLRSLGPPSKVTVIPGNHDAYVANAWDRSFHLWADYMSSDAVHGFPRERKDRCSTFPLLRIRGGTALIGVSTAQPTLPFLAVGSIGKTQLKTLEKILSETRQKRLFRVVMIHHPPFPGAVSWRKRLTDYAAFQALLERHGAELILHGHAHRTSLRHIETSWGKVFAIGVPSASGFGGTAGHKARYHICRFVSNEGRLELLLSVRVYSPNKQCFVGERDQRLPVPQTYG